MLDGGPSATLFAGDGRAEAHGLGKALGSGEPIVARLAARLRTRPLRVHGRIDDDALARAVVRADARSLVRAARPRPPPPSTGDGVPLARLVGSNDGAAGARGGSGAGEQLPRQRAARRRAADVDGGPFTAPTWLRALGLAACKGCATARDARSRRASGCRAERCSRARARRRARRRRADGDPPEGRGPAAVGHLRARARSGRVARAERSERLRGRARARRSWRSAARSAPDARAGPRARRGVTAFPATLAAAPAALRDAKAHGRDRSTLADRRAATAAALGVADVLADAEAGGAPHLGQGAARRIGDRDTAPGRPSRSRCAACASSATRRSTASSRTTSKSGSVYAALSLRAADGSTRAFVLAWNTKQAKGYAAARGSADGRPLLLVLRAPEASSKSEVGRR